MIGELLRALELAGVGLKAFEEIAAIVQGDDHTAIVTAIRRIVDIVTMGFHAQMDSAAILAEIDKLKSEITANNAQIDSEIDQKFRGSP